MSIKSLYPDIRPSLLLDFANAKQLDPRITFTRTSTATYVGRDGLIKTAGLNQPRFDHDPVTGESLGLLIEESRTNIALYSQEFNNGYWSKTGGGNPGSTVTANQAVAPDGTTTADFIDYTTATANSQNIERSYDNTPAGKTYTASVWIKGTSGQTINLTLDGYGENGSAEQFTLNGNWQRFSITRTYPAGSPAAMFRFGTRNLNHPSTGTATQIYAWGAQIEEASFSTSYIPTSGSTVTRAVDSTSIIGESYSSVINSNEGTILMNFIPDTKVDTDSVVLSFDNGSNYPWAIYRFFEDIWKWYNGNDSIVSLKNGFSNSLYKFGIAFDQTNGSATESGSLLYSNLSSLRMSTKYANSYRLGIGYSIPGGSYRFTGKISKLAYYPKRLTDAQLQTLTK